MLDLLKDAQNCPPPNVIPSLERLCQAMVALKIKQICTYFTENVQ